MTSLQAEDTCVRQNRKTGVLLNGLEEVHWAALLQRQFCGVSAVLTGASFFGGRTDTPQSGTTGRSVRRHAQVSLKKNV